MIADLSWLVADLPDGSRVLEICDQGGGWQRALPGWTRYVVKRAIGRPPFQIPWRPNCDADAVWRSGALHDSLSRHLHHSFDLLIAPICDDLPHMAALLASAENLLRSSGRILLWADAPCTAPATRQGGGARPRRHAAADLLGEISRSGRAGWRVVANVSGPQPNQSSALLCRGAGPSPQTIGAGERASPVEPQRAPLEPTPSRTRARRRADFFSRFKRPLVRPPRRAPAVSEQDVALLRQSGLFDRDYYLAQCRDPDAADQPEAHYLLNGASLGLDPSLQFETCAYLQANEDVARAEYNPLLHYLRHGREEVRMPVSVATWFALYAAGDDNRPRVPAELAGPLISVVMPVCDPPLGFLQDALASVLDQTYRRLQLCVVDDGSRSAAVRAALADRAGQDRRVTLLTRPQRGGIAAATNDGLAAAQGLFVGLMDHDDILAPTALERAVQLFAAEPEMDIAFTDELLIDAVGRPIGAYCKPGWNRDLFMAHNLISHFGLYRRTLIERIGGVREGFQGSQDYDLALRAVAASANERIRHIPEFLYRWRQSPESFSALHADQCARAARRAVQAFLDEQQPGAVAVPANGLPRQNRVLYPVPVPAPLVSCLVACTDDGAAAVRDLQNASAARAVEFVPVPIPQADAGAGLAAARNEAVARSHGEVLIFVDGGLTPTAADWIDELVAHALRDTVAAVGTKIISHDGFVLHAGLALDPERGVVPLHYGEPGFSVGYHGHLALQREVAAVSAACMAMTRRRFVEVGPFACDAQNDQLHDVDWCLRARQRGLAIAWTPHARLIAPDRFVSPPPPLPDAAVLTLRQRWGEELARRPFSSPWLHPTGRTFAVPPRRPALTPPSAASLSREPA